MKTMTHEEVLGRIIGEAGTPEQIAFENELKAEILAHRFKELRKRKTLPRNS